MESKSQKVRVDPRDIVEDKTSLCAPRQRGELERMARRRFQNPAPFRERNFWWLLYWHDELANGVRIRKRKRRKLAPAKMAEREVKKIAAEFLRPLNQGLVTLGSATEFREYVDSTYRTTVLPLMAKSTRDRYEGVIKNYLTPSFGDWCLRDLTPLSVQQYFSSLKGSPLFPQPGTKRQTMR